MHIPDGFLDLKTAIAAGAVAAGGLGLALRQAGRRLPRRRVPLMGLTAAAVFAAQMLNFPVAGGTSGHLLGGVLAAVLVGPAAAVVVLSAVLIVQALMFSDGGITALGANIFNMAVVATVGGYAIYAVARRFMTGIRGMLAASAFAGWCSIVLAAICCAGELSLSGTAPRWLVFPAMANVHMLIGLGEALITALILAAVAKARPELIYDADTEKLSPFSFPVIAVGLLITVALLFFIAPVASQRPDGLEHVAGVLGFAHREAEAPIGSPMAAYRVPGISWPAAATALAGAIGAIVVFILSLLLARVLAPVRADRSAATGT